MQYASGVTSLVDRLLEYIEGPCGREHFRDGIKGVSEERLLDFERKHFGGPIPADFREYLARMGEDSRDYRLIDPDMGFFRSIERWYSTADEESFTPRGNSIIIAVGMEEQYFL